jgi:hypothetical protein
MDKLRGGILNTMARVFNLFSSGGSTLLDVVESESETERMADAQRLHDFYQGDADEICNHLVATLQRTFSQDDINEFQMLYLPVMRRIIDKLCIVYKGETERYLDGEGETEKLTDLYTSAGIDAKSKYWYRMGKLHHTVLVQPVVREVDGEKVLNFDIWTPNKITVIEAENNFLLPSKVIYQVQVRKPDGKHEVNTVFWSKDEHFRLNEKGNVIPDPLNPNGENPYGVLPFVVLRFGETDNFWGEGETVLANIEEKVDVLLIQLMDLLIMQGHGQPVLNNARVEGDVRTGPKHPLQLSPSNPDQPASFEFATVTGKVSEITSAIDWLINKTSVMYGLAQSSEIGQSSVASGYAKMLDNWDIIEKREEDIAVLQDFERELFDVTRAVVEYEGLETFSEAAAGKFYVEFCEYEFPQDPKVEIDVKKLKLDLGLWTPLDDLMEDDPTLTKDEAFAVIEENLTIRNRMRDEFGMTQPLGNANDPNMDPNMMKADGLQGQ